MLTPTPTPTVHSFTEVHSLGLDIIPVLSSLLFILVFLVPIGIGFTWLRSDANRIRQPGILWAILTIPFGWLILLAYLIVRALPRNR